MQRVERKQIEDDISKTKCSYKEEAPYDQEHTKSTSYDSPPQDVKDARTDMKTLPESRNIGESNEKIIADSCVL